MLNLSSSNYNFNNIFNLKYYFIMLSKFEFKKIDLKMNMCQGG